jgi:hypothetical protein
MTFLALYPTESCSPHGYEGPVSAIPTETTSVPRISLRKRSVNTDRRKAALSTVNSAFLSGLFADVAKVQLEFDNADPQNSGPRTDQSLPSKKSRFSTIKAMSRCGKSKMSLGDALVSPPPSPDNVNIFDVLSFSAAFPTARSTDLERKDSLLFQPHCVSSSSSSSSDESSVAATTKTMLDAAMLEIPHLPATISATSCSTLTRNPSDLPSTRAEKSQKESYDCFVKMEEEDPKVPTSATLEESYGWFVEIEEEDQKVPTSTTFESYVSTSAVELAFRAPTARKSSHHDAEMEWAKAADTVDDVLGDFF